MTHFTVLVCAHSVDEVDELLAPYDENKEVEPYRSYEEGNPEDHWAYTALKDDYQKALKTPADADRELEARARIFRQLPEVPTWKHIAWLYNTKYGDDGDRMFTEDLPAGPRAYTMSTYNPQSKWDWWVIGGRWGAHFKYRPQYEHEVLMPEKRWSSPDLRAGHCDGGPKYALDLAGTREEAAREARKTHEKYHRLVAGLPEGRSWAEHRAMLDSVPGYTIDMAREDYRSQPRMKALKGTNFEWADDPIAYFRRPADVLAEQARASSVPGYATVRLDGRWMAPGEMGWFACSSDDEGDRIQYREAANAYVESLPDDVWLIMTDCHI